MAPRADEPRRCFGETLLRLNYSPEFVATKVNVAKRSAFTWQRRLQMYGGLRSPHSRPAGRRQAIHSAAERSLLTHLSTSPWLYQDEIAVFLKEEWDIKVHKSTISRFLKRHRWSRKKGHRIASGQSDILRTQWQSDMRHFTANQLVFLDESIFKWQTGWRGYAYAPIGDPARWSDAVRRGDTWSILPAYTTEGYLPCTGKL